MSKLRCKAIHGSAYKIAWMVTLLLYPYPPDEGNDLNEPFVPGDFIEFLKEIEPGKFWCFLHQFTITVKRVGEFWEIHPDIQHYPDVVTKWLEAICVLHPQFEIN